MYPFQFLKHERDGTYDNFKTTAAKNNQNTSRAHYCCAEVLEIYCMLQRYSLTSINLFLTRHKTCTVLLFNRVGCNDKRLIV